MESIIITFIICVAVVAVCYIGRNNKKGGE